MIAKEREGIHEKNPKKTEGRNEKFNRKKRLAGATLPAEALLHRKKGRKAGARYPNCGTAGWDPSPSFKIATGVNKKAFFLPKGMLARISSSENQPERQIRWSGSVENGARGDLYSSCETCCVRRKYSDPIASRRGSRACNPVGVKAGRARAWEKKNSES